MKCPTCGRVELVHDTRDVTYTHKGETTTIRAVTGDFCPACNEVITDQAETDRLMHEMLRAQVQASMDDDQARVRFAERKAALRSDNPREALARELVADLQGQTVFGDAHNGLFLAAPRRTGKSTFLQADLRPALEAAGVVVVYVDLWADPRRDSGSLIAEVIARALAPRLGRAAGALKIDVSQIGKIDGVTLHDALRALHESAKAPVALLIDEAQHALTSKAGEAAMSALKSARDQINRPGAVNLMLVMSGSDRDMLRRLLNTNGAPFYGSKIREMS